MIRPCKLVRSEFVPSATSAGVSHRRQHRESTTRGKSGEHVVHAKGLNENPQYFILFSIKASQEAIYAYDINMMSPFMHMNGTPLLPVQIQSPLLTLIPGTGKLTSCTNKKLFGMGTTRSTIISNPIVIGMTFLRDSGTGFVPVFGQNPIIPGQNVPYSSNEQPFQPNPGPP